MNPVNIVCHNIGCQIREDILTKCLRKIRLRFSKFCCTSQVNNIGSSVDNTCWFGTRFIILESTYNYGYKFRRNKNHHKSVLKELQK